MHHNFVILIDNANIWIFSGGGNLILVFIVSDNSYLVPLCLL